MQGQDSLKWLNDGWVDVVFYMKYKNDFKIKHVDLARSKTTKPDSIILILSLYDLDTLEKKPGKLINKSIYASRRLWPNMGMAYYHYKHLTNEHIFELSNGAYSRWKSPRW